MMRVLLDTIKPHGVGINCYLKKKEVQNGPANSCCVVAMVYLATPMDALEQLVETIRGASNFCPTLCNQMQLRASLTNTRVISMKFNLSGTIALVTWRISPSLHSNRAPTYRPVARKGGGVEFCRAGYAYVYQFFKDDAILAKMIVQYMILCLRIRIIMQYFRPRNYVPLI